MTQQNPRSLRHEYELYVENEIENYKESVSRSAILKIGDEAAAALRDGEQFAMDELLLWAEVDRIIRKRLRIPAYETWRRKRVKMLAEYKRPEHSGEPPDGVLAREIHPPAESKVLVAGGEIDRTALYLARPWLQRDGGRSRSKPLERVMNAAQEAGLADRSRAMSPTSPTGPPTFSLARWCARLRRSSDSRLKSGAVRSSLLQTATRDGGVHWSERSCVASGGCRWPSCVASTRDGRSRSGRTRDRPRASSRARSPVSRVS